MRATREFRKERPFNVTGHASMAESIDHDKGDTCCPLSYGDPEGCQKRAGINKGCFLKKQTVVRNLLFRNGGEKATFKMFVIVGFVFSNLC